jgi:hypothetical protein
MRYSIKSNHPNSKAGRPVLLNGMTVVGELEGVKGLLKQYNLKRRDFARIAGYSFRSIEIFFRGKRKFPIGVLIALEREIDKIQRGQSIYTIFTN